MSQGRSGKHIMGPAAQSFWQAQQKHRWPEVLVVPYFCQDVVDVHSSHEVCRFEELKYRSQKIHAFLLKARACAADEGHYRLLARNVTEFSACLRFREGVRPPLKVPMIDSIFVALPPHSLFPQGLLTIDSISVGLPPHSLFPQGLLCPLRANDSHACPGLLLQDGLSLPCASGNERTI